MSSLKLSLIIGSFLFTSSCNSDETKIQTNSELISKKFFIKGMTCGGCIIGVKAALEKAKKLNIIDRNISVGEALLKFDRNSYKGNLTDCEVSKTIEKFTEFKVYMNKSHTQKACKL